MRASLRVEYQITDMRAESVLELADLVAWLPPGSPLWRAYGGPMAQSAELAKLVEIEFRLRELSWMQSKDGAAGRNRPKPPEAPKYAREREAEEAEAMRKAEWWQRHHSL